MDLSSGTKYSSYAFRHLPRSLLVKQDQPKINLKDGKLNLNYHRYNQIFTHPHVSPSTPPGSPSKPSATFLHRCPGLLHLRGGAALHLRQHQGSNTCPVQKTEANVSDTALDLGCIRRSGNIGELWKTHHSRPEVQLKKSHIYNSAPILILAEDASLMLKCHPPWLSSSWRTRCFMTPPGSFSSKIMLGILACMEPVKLYPFHPGQTGVRGRNCTCQIISWKN